MKSSTLWFIAGVAWFLSVAIRILIKQWSTVSTDLMIVVILFWIAQHER